MSNAPDLLNNRPARPHTLSRQDATSPVARRIDQALSALRRVIHASDQHSRHLARTTGLTSPQILLLQIIRDHEKLTIGELARAMSLSQATVTSILDRLEKRQLVVRQRSARDRRKVYVNLTEQANQTLKHARIPLQEQLTRQFSHLQEWEQTSILSALQRMADMMDAEHIKPSGSPASVASSPSEAASNASIVDRESWPNTG